MSSKLVIMMIAVAAAPVAAQPVEHPSLEPEAPATEAPATATPPAAAARLELSVQVSSAPGEIDADEVRAAIAAELEIRVTDQDAFDPALGRLAVTVDQGAVRVVYQPAEGTRVERTLALPAAQADRVQLITFVASNLVRDQASEILAALARKPADVAGPASSDIEVREFTAPPEGRYTSVELAATIGFIPPFSVDRIVGRHVVIGVGLNALVGMTDGSQIFSVSGLVDVKRQFATGLQLGGLASVAGRVDYGVQVGGLVALSRGTTYGMQLGGIGAVSRADVTGLQVGGLATASGGDLTGLQLAGLASLSRRDMLGIQVGGVATVAKHARGLQLGGITSIADRMEGIQVGGVATVGGDVTGVQIGLVNVARKMRGLQLGLVNITDDGDDAIPIGLLNFARNGRLEVDGWVESNGLTGAALRHGPKRVQNIVGLAWSPDHDHVLAGVGLGIHNNITRGRDPITVDVDAVNWWTDLWNGNFGQLEQLRVTVAVPVGPIDLIGGAAANVYIGDDMKESENFHPVLARTYTSDGGTHVVTWPSVFAGIRLRAR